VRDVWRWKDAGPIAGEYTASVARHGVMLVRMWPAPSGMEVEASASTYRLRSLAQRNTR